MSEEQRALERKLVDEMGYAPHQAAKAAAMLGQRLGQH